MTTALGRAMRHVPVGGHRVRVFFAATAAVLSLGVPPTAMASTQTEPPTAACHLPTSAAVAGTPFELSGTTTSAERVGLLARKDTGETREASVATLNGTWRAVIVFGAEDAGQWTVDLVVDGADCVSPLTVTLPAGMVAPPTRAPIDETAIEPPPTGVDGSTILTAAAAAGAAAVVGSWLFLSIIAAAQLVGARPLQRRRLRAIVQSATFVAVLGGFATVGLVFYVGFQMSHFDTGLPSGEAALLDISMWGVVVAGSAIGVIAARRVGHGAEDHAR